MLSLTHWLTSLDVPCTFVRAWRSASDGVVVGVDVVHWLPFDAASPFCLDADVTENLHDSTIPEALARSVPDLNS